MPTSHETLRQIDRLRTLHSYAFNKMIEEDEKHVSKKTQKTPDLPYAVENEVFKAFKDDKYNKEPVLGIAYSILRHEPHPLIRGKLIEVTHPELKVKLEYEDSDPSRVLAPHELDRWGFSSIKDVNTQHIIDLKLLVAAVCTALNIGEKRHQMPKKGEVTRGVKKATPSSGRATEEYLRGAVSGRDLIRRVFSMINQSAGISGEKNRLAVLGEQEIPCSLLKHE